MAVSTIALYATPPTSTNDFDINARSSSSTSASSSQKPIIGGLSSLFSSSSTYSDDFRHEKVEDFTSSFSYHPLNSFAKRDSSPVSVFQGPLSATSSPVIMRFGGDFSGSGRIGSRNGLFIGHAVASCIDYDSPRFEMHHTKHQVDDLTFNMEDSFVESNYAKDLLLNAQSKHKIFYDDVVVKAFNEAEKAHQRADASKWGSLFTSLCGDCNFACDNRCQFYSCRSWTSP